MGLELTRGTLRFERFVGRSGEQVTIEGEATLPGSMRDAVTVLSVQAQAHLTDAQAGNGEAGVRGRVCFQVLYTQGDLTRIRTLETRCDFTHTLPLEGIAPGMRLSADAVVLETEGVAGSGRVTLRALLEIRLEAFEASEREIITGAAMPDASGNLQLRMQRIACRIGQTPGQGRTTVRGEFELPQRLGVGDVLGATATATAGDLAGGNGRVSVSGVIEVRVLHRPVSSGEALVSTVHEMPYELSIDAQLPEGVRTHAIAQVTDVMADSVQGEKGRTLRMEAEVRVMLQLGCQKEMDAIEDLYSLSGPVLEPALENLELHTAQMETDARESVRIQVVLGADAPPVGLVLAAFAQPTLTGMTPSGRRLDAEGIMNVTLIYLPQDSDIPYAVHTREPFTMTFPIEAQEGVSGYAYAIETAPGPSTSDRVEIRCVLGLHAVQHETKRVRVVTDVQQKPEEKQERGFVLVWPKAGETRWDTARRLRVAQDSLRPAGKNALLALKR